MKNKTKTCQAVVNNKLETFYISHSISDVSEINGGENFKRELLVCGLPNQVVHPNKLKKNNSPRVFLDKSCVLWGQTVKRCWRCENL